MNFMSPKIAHMDFTELMREAMREAELSGQADELPIGAVVVIDGKIVSRGHNTRKQHTSQLRHAELNAMLEGGQPLWENYERAILVTTVEPCPLCLGAAVMADIPHIVFALHDHIVYSGLSVETNPYIRKHIRTYQGGILAEEVTALISQYNPAFLKAIGKSDSEAVGVGSKYTDKASCLVDLNQQP